MFRINDKDGLDQLTRWAGLACTLPLTHIIRVVSAFILSRPIIGVRCDPSWASGLVLLISLPTNCRRLGESRVPAHVIGSMDEGPVASFQPITISSLSGTEISANYKILDPLSG